VSQHSSSFLERIHPSENCSRAVLELYKTEAAKIDKKRYSELGLREELNKVRAKYEAQLNRIDKAIGDEIGDSYDHQSAWTREALLRESRFFPAYEGQPGTLEAQQKAINHELLEELRRGRAERKAERYTVEDLVAETERAARDGDVATLAVFQQEARHRGLKSLDKLHFDRAVEKLELPDVAEAEQAYRDFDALLKEASGLAQLWRNPQDQSGTTQEQLGRINRNQRDSRFVKAVESGLSEKDAVHAQWLREPPKAKPEPPAEAVKKPTPIIPLEREQPPATQPDTPEPPLAA
jgi:hypothetical protein